MNTPEQDRLDRDLEKLESRYRKLEGDSPPDMLDQAILNRARRAVDKTSTRPWSFGWMHAAATTALVVIGLTLVLQQRPGLTPEPPPPAESRSAVDAVQERNFQGLRAGNEGDAEPAAAISALDSDAPMDSEQRLREEKETSEAVKSGRRDKDDLQKQQVGQQAGQEPAAPVFRSRVSEPVQSPEMVEDEQQAHEPFNVPASEEAHDVSEAEQDREPARQARPASLQAKRENLGESLSDTMSARSGPEDWLASIEAQRLEREESGWLEELTRFIEAYPDYPLPESLREAYEAAGGNTEQP